MKRCSWVDENSQIYKDYHDNEWGVPKYDDHELFELLILESFQAGLSWLTVLKKRDAFRLAFDNFDVKKVANYDENKVNELLQNEGIIRSRSKINSAISNAKIFIQIQKEYIDEFLHPDNENRILADWRKIYSQWLEIKKSENRDMAIKKLLIYKRTDEMKKDFE